MSEIKPCPFCGGEAKRGNMRVNGVLQHRVRCATCEAMSPLCDSEGEAEETWNRRDLTGNSRFADCHIWEPGDKLDTLSDKCDVLIKVADIKALIAQPANEPLTLDELRGMDGEPVYIVAHPDWGHWELAEDAEDYLGDRDPDFYGMKMRNDPEGRYGLHVLGWLAYRRKPEGSEND